MKVKRRTTTAEDEVITGMVFGVVCKTSATTTSAFVKSLFMMSVLVAKITTAGTAVSAFIVPPPPSSSRRVPSSVTAATTTTTCLHLFDSTTTPIHFTELRPLPSSVTSFSSPDVLRNSGLRYLPLKQRQHCQRPRRQLDGSSLSSTQHTTTGTSEPTDHVRDEYTDIDIDPVTASATATASAAVTTTKQTTNAGPRQPLTEKQKQAWQQKFKEMKQYQDANNGSSYPPRGTPLSKWAQHQRKTFNKGQIYPDRLESLNSINFQWSKPRVGIPRLDWDKMFGRLVEYKERCGDTDVPWNYPTNPQFGEWCYTQKDRYSKGKLDPGRKAKLDAIGFVFHEIVSYDDRWDDKYGRLVEYWKKNTSTIVPRSHEEDPELARWVTSQRRYYNSNDSIMTPERIERLEAIGFVWNAQEAAWLEMYNRLNEYKQEEGNADVPQKYKKDPKLGRWVDRQRKTYRKGKLSPDRIEKLEEIGFRWSLRSTSAEKAKLQDKLW